MKRPKGQVTGRASDLLGKEIFLTGRLFHLIDPRQIACRKKATDPNMSLNKYVITGSLASPSITYPALSPDLALEPPVEGL